MTPVTLNLTAQRWAAYVETPIAFEGRDYSEATLAMQLRQYRDATGSPLVSLTTQDAGTQGLSCVVTTDGDDNPTSWITIQIDEATLEAVLPWPANGQKANTDVVLFHDLVITGGGHAKRRRAAGTFTIQPGATQ